MRSMLSAAVPAALGLVLLACTAEVENPTLGGPSVQKELCPTGCPEAVDEVLGQRGPWEQYGRGVFVRRGDHRDTETDPCSLLPDDGPCSMACDPDKLASTLPSGKCTTLRCDLPDGSVIVAGACEGDASDLEVEERAEQPWQRPYEY